MKRMIFAAVLAIATLGGYAAAAPTGNGVKNTCCPTPCCERSDGCCGAGCAACCDNADKRCADCC